MADSVKFKYLFQEDYNPKYANGVYGGVSPTGELVMNFYFERLSIPYEVMESLDENGNLTGSSEIVKPKEYKIIRSVENGVILNKSGALDIYHWLEEQLKQMGAEDGELRNGIHSDLE